MAVAWRSLSKATAFPHAHAARGRSHAAPWRCSCRRATSAPPTLPG